MNEHPGTLGPGGECLKDNFKILKEGASSKTEKIPKDQLICALVETQVKLVVFLSFFQD